MNDPTVQPAIPSRLRRPLAAVWISLALHAAVIALVQVAPPGSMSTAEPPIEVRLVSSSAAAQQSPSQATSRTQPVEVPLLVPRVTAEAPPVSAPVPEPRDEPASPVPPAKAVVAVETSAASQAEPPVEPGPADEGTPAVAAAQVAINSGVDLTYYNVRDLDVQPRALREIVPEYPADADRRQVSGKVRVRLKIEANGRVSNAEVVDATPPGLFEDATLKAFRDVRFSPAQRNGRPVRAQVLIEVVYDWEGRTRNQ